MNRENQSLPPLAGCEYVLGRDGRPLCFQGGMAVVYKVRHVATNSFRAVKVLKRENSADETSIRRLHREADICFQLKHRNIINVFEKCNPACGDHPGLHYFVMDWVEGQNLGQIIKARGRLKPEEIVHIISQVCDALYYAHNFARQPIIHRDIKPSNILVERGTGQVVLADFGIAHAPDTSRLTDIWSVAGTAEYMSPEHMDVEKMDQRSDIYSLGVVMFQMATGTVPFTAASGLSVLAMHLRARAVSPVSRYSGVPPWLNTIILYLLRKDRNKRYQTAADLKQALIRGLEQGRMVRPPAVTRLWLLATAATVCVILFGIAAVLFLTRDNLSSNWASVQRRMARSPAQVEPLFQFTAGLPRYRAESEEWSVVLPDLLRKMEGLANRARVNLDVDLAGRLLRHLPDLEAMVRKRLDGPAAREAARRIKEAEAVCFDTIFAAARANLDEGNYVDAGDKYSLARELLPEDSDLQVQVEQLLADLAAGSVIEAQTGARILTGEIFPEGVEVPDIQQLLSRIAAARESGDMFGMGEVLSEVEGPEYRRNDVLRREIGRLEEDFLGGYPEWAELVREKAIPRDTVLVGEQEWREAVEKANDWLRDVRPVQNTVKELNREVGKEAIDGLISWMEKIADRRAAGWLRPSVIPRDAEIRLEHGERLWKLKTADEIVPITPGIYGVVLSAADYDDEEDELRIEAGHSRSSPLDFIGRLEPRANMGYVTIRTWPSRERIHIRGSDGGPVRTLLTPLNSAFLEEGEYQLLFDTGSVLSFTLQPKQHRVMNFVRVGKEWREREGD